MSHLDLSRVPSFYHRYVERTIHDDLSTAFRKHLENIVPLLKDLPAEKWDYRYEPGKWSIKELVQHLIDAERIFAYRALCFARKDRTKLPGFDEDAYALHSVADKRSPEQLINELESVQQATMHLFESFTEEQLEEKGIANENTIYVKAIGYVIVGHVLHHRAVLEERYLADVKI